MQMSEKCLQTDNFPPRVGATGCDFGVPELDTNFGSNDGFEVSYSKL